MFYAIYEQSIKFRFIFHTLLRLLLHRKRTILLSHTLVFVGVALSCSCVAANTPEMFMLGRVLLGVNSGNFVASSFGFRDCLRDFALSFFNHHRFLFAV